MAQELDAFGFPILQEQKAKPEQGQGGGEEPDPLMGIPEGVATTSPYSALESGVQFAEGMIPKTPGQIAATAGMIAAPWLAETYGPAMAGVEAAGPLMSKVLQYIPGLSKFGKTLTQAADVSRIGGLGPAATRTGIASAGAGAGGFAGGLAETPGENETRLSHAAKEGISEGAWAAATTAAVEGVSGAGSWAARKLKESRNPLWVRFTDFAAEKLGWKKAAERLASKGQNVEGASFRTSGGKVRERIPGGPILERDQAAQLINNRKMFKDTVKDYTENLKPQVMSHIGDTPFDLKMFENVDPKWLPPKVQGRLLLREQTEKELEAEAEKLANRSVTRSTRKDFERQRYQRKLKGEAEVKPTPTSLGGKDIAEETQGLGGKGAGTERSTVTTTTDVTPGMRLEDAKAQILASNDPKYAKFKRLNGPENISGKELDEFRQDLNSRGYTNSDDNIGLTAQKARALSHEIGKVTEAKLRDVTKGGVDAGLADEYKTARNNLTAQNIIHNIWDESKIFTKGRQPDYGHMQQLFVEEMPNLMELIGKDQTEEMAKVLFRDAPTSERDIANAFHMHSSGLGLLSSPHTSAYGGVGKMARGVAPMSLGRATTKAGAARVLRGGAQRDYGAPQEQSAYHPLPMGEGGEVQLEQ